MVVNLGFLDRSHWFLVQVAPHLSLRGWVDPVPDPLLLRISSSAGIWTWDLWICSEKLWSLDNRGDRRDVTIPRIGVQCLPPETALSGATILPGTCLYSLLCVGIGWPFFPQLYTMQAHDGICRSIELKRRYKRKAPTPLSPPWALVALHAGTDNVTAVRGLCTFTVITIYNIQWRVLSSGIWRCLIR
jgi:hypothetical protein